MTIVNHFSQFITSQITKVTLTVAAPERGVVTWTRKF